MNIIVTGEIFLAIIPHRCKTTNTLLDVIATTAPA
jgi:hypothetical protein